MGNHLLAGLFIAAFLGTTSVHAQQTGHGRHGHQISSGADSVEINDHDKHAHHEPGLPAASLFTPMSMEGSGTSWLPATSPVHGLMSMPGEWMIMLHGAGTLRYSVQGGPRGESAWSAPNWFMGMAQRPVGGRGQLKLRAMLSLDRPIDGGDGYPLLLQTGETWQGEHLVDRQHPHDLFDELSTTYTHAFTDLLTGFMYLGYPGEPALGPSAFMHRPSALYNPDAPISHHWQDATHITFGVATAGWVFDRVKVEGSIFTGREPDENRYNFDKPRFDSYSGRLSFNLSEELALQASYGKIKNPEADGSDARRTTASVLHSMSLDDEAALSSSFVWGENNDAHAGTMQSFLLESLANFGDNALYIRFENVQKPRGELGIEDDHDRKERVSHFTFGANRRIYGNEGVDLRLGIQGTFYNLPKDLKPFYGKNPVSLQVYISLTPALHSGHQGH